eukprot:TRINITY_DN821_c0_g1_i1.p1 TRINITY_DN821_c0_g1~~TRINITY_DN821_c0_g1_i1.p1  ORF type:complete len:345 (+),score=89.21 TRINITY_DN821_c0_g1_i1:103-1137(+)
MEFNDVKKVGVFGAGQFGYALAKILSDQNPDLDICLYDAIPDVIEYIREHRAHPYFHKGAVLGDNVTCVSTPAEAATDAQLILLAVPGNFLRGCVRDLVPIINGEVILLNVAKAIEQKTQKFLHTVIHEEIAPVHYPVHIAALAGGMLAEEVTKGWPIGADVACSEIRIAKIVRKLFYSPTFKMNVTSDLLGLELAGAFKNVIAIGAGIFDGLGLAVSSKAAYISEAANEMSELGISLGADPSSFGLGTHSWLGDLLTTSFGNSRNRLFGEFIGSGMTVQEALDKLHSQKKISEGYHTCKAFYQISLEKNKNLPILKNLYKILYEDLPLQDGIDSFFFMDRAHL